MRTLLRHLGIPVAALVLVALSSVGVAGQEEAGTVTIT
jgi:hypothetical protein